jgi:hypothetical protein
VNQDAEREPEAGAPVVSPTLARALEVIERGTTGLLVLTIVGFGVWTLTYQAALVTGMPSTPTLVVAAVLAAAVGAAVLPHFVADRAPAPGTGSVTTLPRWLLLAAVGVFAVCVLLGALDRRGVMVALLTVGAAALVVMSLRSRARGARATGSGRRLPPVASDDGSMASGPTSRRRPLQGGLWLCAWFWALACAALSSVTARPDGDDAYFVNLAQWVSDRGSFPTRDTMLADEAFPALRSHSPPVHSIEGLIGAIGHVTGMSGGVLTYVVAAPALTCLAVLTLAWLVSLSAIRFAPLALSAAVVFLLASGGSGASFGNFFALRMWQGKATLATLVLPLLTAAAIAYVSRGGWRRLVVLGLAVVCTIGASNTAVFLVPVLVAGVVVASLVHSGPRRAAGALLALLYPLACGVAVLLLAPAAPDGEGGSGNALDPLVAVPGRSGLFVVTVAALCLGWLGLRAAHARAVAVGVLFVAAAALVPVVTDALVAAAHVGSVVWRMWWVVPVPLLVAGLVGAGVELWRGLLPRATHGGRTLAVVAVVGALVVGLTPLVGGKWIWSSRNGTRWVSPLAWKVPVGAEEEARAALRISRDGDVVLAPWDVSRALSAMSVDVHPVSARAIYLPAYAGDPAARVPERIELQTFVDSRTPPVESLRPLLDDLSVDTACVSRRRGKAVDALELLGFEARLEAGGLVCLRR